jgi:hypothetical protein
MPRYSLHACVSCDLHRFCAEVPEAFAARLRPLLPFLLSLRADDASAAAGFPAEEGEEAVPMPAGENIHQSRRASGLLTPSARCAACCLLLPPTAHAPAANAVPADTLPAPHALQGGPRSCCLCCCKSPTQVMPPGAAIRSASCGWMRCQSPRCCISWFSTRASAPPAAPPPSPLGQPPRQTMPCSMPASCC